MDCGASTSTWMPSHHILRPVVILTFDLQNLNRSSLGASEYSLLSFIKIAEAIHEILWLVS